MKALKVSECLCDRHGLQSGCRKEGCGEAERSSASLVVVLDIR